MAIVMDTEIKEMEDFRYQTLVEMFGKEEADKIVMDESEIDPSELDDDIQELIEFGSKDVE